MRPIDADAIQYQLVYKEKFMKGTGREELAAWKEDIDALPTVNFEQRWIPVSERLPKDTNPVNITWTNRAPDPYYASIKDVPFTATGHYHNGKWWWYSATCQDYLKEYGESEVDTVADGIEILAWQPLPEPYREVE